MYKLLRNFLFLFPAELVHHVCMRLLRLACKLNLFRNLIRSGFTYADPGLNKELLGLTFKNPVGLAAGFDKNAEYLTALECLGFGFVEIGTVTPKAQDGNDKPRLFRLKKDQALINRMGFNNSGANQIAATLKEWRDRQKKEKNIRELPMLIGGNIGKNKSTPNEEAWKDYEYVFRALHAVVDYFVVNVSSPNTPGLRALQEKDALRKILVHLQSVNRELNEKPRPILLKIAPDLTREQIDDTISLAREIQLDGLVATNTTISRDGLSTPTERLQSIGSGGLSGKPLQKKSTEIVKYISLKSEGNIPLIGSGGIFTPEDALEKLHAGASLVQVWTGFIYEGPSIVKRILHTLVNPEHQN